ncbi:hypothetical protein D3C85_1654560 [compost metagenome]
MRCGAVGAGPAHDNEPCPRRCVDEVVERSESGHPPDKVADGHESRGDVVGAIQPVATNLPKIRAIPTDFERPHGLITGEAGQRANDRYHGVALR